MARRSTLSTMTALTPRERYTFFRQKRGMLRILRETKRPMSEQDRMWGDVNHLRKELPQRMQDWLYRTEKVDPHTFVQTRRIVSRARSMAEEARMSGDKIKRRVARAVEDSALFRMPADAKDRIDRDVRMGWEDDHEPENRNAALDIVRM